MSVRIKALLSVLATGIAFGVLVASRGFFVQHAALVALAVGALVYTTLGTTERLGKSYRREGPRSVRPRSPDEAENGELEERSG